MTTPFEVQAPPAPHQSSAYRRPGNSFTMHAGTDMTTQLDVWAPPSPRQPSAYRHRGKFFSLHAGTSATAKLEMRAPLSPPPPSLTRHEGYVSSVRDAIARERPSARLVFVCSAGVRPMAHVHVIDTDARLELPKSPKDATVTLMLVEFHDECVKRAAMLLGDPHSRIRLPTLAMLLPSDLGSQDQAFVTDHLTALTESGADDTCALPTAAGDLPAAIAAGVLRAETCWQRKQSLQMADRELRKSRIQCERLFWQHAHEILLDFPEERPGLREDHCRLGKIMFDEKLGAGASGTVYTWHGPRKPIGGVVKVIPKSSVRNLDHLFKISTEYNMLCRVQHPNVARGQGLVHGRHNLYIFMEMGGPSNLCRLIREEGRGLQWDQACRLLRCVANGLAHCHKLKIAHCDLKPENVVVAVDGCAKIVDLGEAVDFGDEVAPLDGPRGTMPFIAPEILYCTPAWSPAGSDIWSLGVVFMEMLCGFNALTRLMSWPVDSLKAVRARADELTMFFSEWPNDGEATSSALEMVASLCRDPPSRTVLQLLACMLQINPQDRLSAAQVAERTLLGVASGASVGSATVPPQTMAPSPDD